MQATGELDPAGEEGATFENVNVGNSESQQGNVGLGNVANAVSIPASAPAKKEKKALTAAQQATMDAQQVQRQKLKDAKAKDTTVSAVATLARLLREGNMGKYETAFQKAVNGTPLTNFRTAKASKKGANTTAKITGINASIGGPTVKGRNGSSQTMPGRSLAGISQTNLRGSNMVNTDAMNATLDTILGIADGLGQQVNEIKRMVKTLKSKKRPTRAPVSRRKTSGVLPPSSGLANALPPLPESVGVNTGVGDDLLDLPPPQAPLETVAEGSAENNENNENNENSAYTPPP
jgi:hypothetical protein